MIERHITFDVLPDRTADFERFFADEYRPAMARSAGFVRSELLRELEAPTRYVMVLRFEDLDGAAGWRTSPVHEGLQPALRALHAGSAVQPYEVVG